MLTEVAYLVPLTLMDAPNAPPPPGFIEKFFT